MTSKPEQDFIVGRAVDITNDHRPVLGPSNYEGLYFASWTCVHPGCKHTVGIPTETSKTVYKIIFVNGHTSTFNHDRTGDITVDWDISALCNVCADHIGNIIVVDGDTIECTECGTTWNMDGTHGHKKETDG